jgi:ABC-type multidrug transport system fused ATPase/permease subunit
MNKADTKTPRLQRTYLDVKAPRVESVFWALKFIRWTWLPIGLSILGRWLSSYIYVYAASLVGYATMAIGQKGAAQSISLPDFAWKILDVSSNPALTALLASSVIVLSCGSIDVLVLWTRAWVHATINKLVTPKSFLSSIQTSDKITIDPSTAVQRWLLKSDLVYFLHESIAATIGNIGTIVISIVATYKASIVAGNVSLACLALWLVTSLILALRAISASRIYAIEHENAGRVIRNGVSLQDDLTPPSMGYFWLTRHSYQIQKLTAAITRYGFWNAMLEGIPNLIARIIPLIAMITALKSGNVGIVIVVMLYLSRLVGPLSSLAGILPWLQTHLISLDRMYEVLVKLFKPLQSNVTGMNVNSFATKDWSVSLNDQVNISYPDMMISKGELLCITGPSGSGKSTYLRSLIGLVRHTGGLLTINGNDTEPHDLSWQQTCLFVPQDPTLIPGTLSENLTCFNEEGLTNNEKEMIKRIFGRDANIDVGIDELGVSVGQRRIISVLRALRSHFDIIMIDEPFSGLDDSRADVLSGLISKGCELGRTFIITSHLHDLKRSGLNPSRLLALDGISCKQYDVKYSTNLIHDIGVS